MVGNIKISLNCYGRKFTHIGCIIYICRRFDTGNGCHYNIFYTAKDVQPDLKLKDISYSAY